MRRFLPRLVAACIAAAALAAAALASDTQVKVGLDGEKAQSFFDEMTGKNWHYVHVNSTSADGGIIYAMVFVHEAAPEYIARSGLDPEAFTKANDEAVSAGMRPVDVSVADARGGGLFSGIWEKRGSEPWYARQGMTHSQLQDVIRQQSAQGLRPSTIEMYRSGDDTLFAAIFEKRNGPDWNVGIELSPADSQDKFKAMAQQGYRPIRISVCDTIDGLRFTEIFEKANGAQWASKSGLSADEFIRLTDENKAKGLSLIDVHAYNDGNGIHYAAIWSQ